MIPLDLTTLGSTMPVPTPEKLVETAKKLLIDLPSKYLNESIMEVNSLLGEMGLPPLPALPQPPTASAITMPAIPTPPTHQSTVTVTTPIASYETRATRLEIH